MKKLLLLVVFLFSVAGVSLAQTYDSTTLNNNNITSNLTLNAGTRYILKGFVYVKAPATLTIPAGTVIYGDKTTTGTLIVERGAKLNANGTANQPIIFTSRLAPGQRGPGDWGGIILLGKARINTVSGADTAAIEGLPGTTAPAYYGGQDDNDNSGVLRYMRLEFPGINLTGVSGNEINGLTMGGVGRGTTLEYIQVSYGGDDSFEWFGGTVNGKYLISYKGVDDDFDMDNGYRGRLQFLLGIKDSNIADVSGSHGFEVDNNANSPNNFNGPRTQPLISNATMIGPKSDTGSVVNPNHKRGFHLRRNMLGSWYNSVIMGYPDAMLFDGSGVGNACFGDTVQIRSMLYAGNKGGFKTTNTGSNFTDATAWINTAAFNNRIFTLNSQVLLTNPYGYANGNWTPLAGSPALTGGNFTYPNLSDPFFTSTTYVGAFAQGSNWTATWAQFSPETYTIGIKQIASEVPQAFTLKQNYPNPFNPSTKINFSLPKAGIVTLKVYDITGKEVANLVNQNLSVGTYEYDFNASNLTSGIYFYTLKTGNFTETKKMMLVK